MRRGFIFLDSTQNYPFEYSAGNTKVEMIARGLLNLDRKVYVINPFWGYDKISQSSNGVSNGIKYMIFPKRGKLYAISNMFKILLLVLRLRKQYKYVIMTSNHFIVYVLECLWLRLLGYKIGVLYHELRYTTLHQPSKYVFYSTKLFDKYFGYFCNYILPISHFLKQRCVKYRRPILLTPVLSSSNFFPLNNDIGNHFLYCSNTEYGRIIRYILEAFKVYSIGGNAELVLVLSGNKEEIQSYERWIVDNNLGKRIIIMSKLPQEELFQLYSKSLALLIPLDNTNLQDKARFSQKIAEYTSTGRPIVTNSVGEIPYYFDLESAYIMNDLDVVKMANLLQDIEVHKDKATKIGANGYQVFKKYFDNETYAIKLLDFLHLNYE